MTLKIPFLVGTVGLLWATQPQQPVREVLVEAGAYERRGAVVSFPMKGVQADRPLMLREGSTSVPVQVDAEGRGWFVLAEMAAGRSRTYRLEEASGPLPKVMDAARIRDDIALTSNGRPVLQYVGGAGALPSPEIKPVFQRGGYLHPVRTPSGRVVTDDYPADHRHHHGVWFAWTKTVFQKREPDFWNMGDGKGRVEFEALKDVWSGPVHAGMRAQHRYVDLTSGKPISVLSEQWETRVFAGGEGARPYFLFDVDVKQTSVAADTLALPEYHYGGIGVRGAAGFVKPDNVWFLTSEGKDRATGDGAESRWAAISGVVDGQPAMLAVLSHPSNFRAPERMRIHPTDPYLCYTPSRSGPWAIAAGATHSARYRFVSMDGHPDPALLHRLWLDYALPPAATVR